MKIIPKKHRHWGFTLVELLPPIGLAGFFAYASMLLPALAKAKMRANRVKCTSNVKWVGSAFKAPPTCLVLTTHLTRLALALALASAGSSIEA
ncbi:MAG: hypothetical protein QGG55_02655 [Verrucomicrobiota bacterium]|nr:hypothetical protein [Verrucomicrobiota bacterium]